MAATLVDSNILLDIATGDATWQEWSAAALRRVGESGELIVNIVIYSEVSAAFDRIEDADTFLDASLCRREDVPWIAGFLAGQAFRQYRKRGGPRTATLPDFLIGAHAVALDLTLLTRDRAYFKSYFPALRVISPVQA